MKRRAFLGFLGLLSVGLTGFFKFLRPLSLRREKGGPPPFLSSISLSPPSGIEEGDLLIVGVVYSECPNRVRNVSESEVSGLAPAKRPNDRPNHPPIRGGRTVRTSRPINVRNVSERHILDDATGLGSALVLLLAVLDDATGDPLGTIGPGWIRDHSEPGAATFHKIATGTEAELEIQFPGSTVAAQYLRITGAEPPQIALESWSSEVVL